MSDVPRRSGPLRVLVVDDNYDAAASLELLMQIWKHEVRTAHEGPQAIDLARTFLPHVVLLDIGLPKMNGYQVAAELRSCLSTATLVAMTGYGQEDDRRRSQEAGFDHHLVKPVEPRVLERLLDSLAEAQDAC
jgi:CheY-like chemotaxis protein